ncbi:hypothetical protein ACFLTD_04650 [Elusimicrobiota bacterium]
MKKTLSIFIVVSILCYSFFGLIQLPGAVQGAFSLIKTVMPFPGKTVMVINKFARFAPFQNASRPARSNPKNKRNEFSPLIFFLLSSIMASADKSMLLLILVIAGMSLVIPQKFLVHFKDIFVPPDRQRHRRWRLKFITPAEKLIQNLAQKYDSNPILMDGRALLCPERNPHFVMNERSAGFFYAYAGPGPFSGNNFFCFLNMSYSKDYSLFIKYCRLATNDYRLVTNYHETLK